MNEGATALTTNCSGGVISGNFFLELDSDLDFESAHAEVVKLCSHYKKWEYLPFGKKKRFHSVYKSSERLLKALWKFRKEKGTDEAVRLLSCYSRFAWNLYWTLGKVYGTDRELSETQKFKDLRYELYRWGVGDYPNYDFFYRPLSSIGRAAVS